MATKARRTAPGDQKAADKAANEECDRVIRRLCARRRRVTTAEAVAVVNGMATGVVNGLRVETVLACLGKRCHALPLAWYVKDQSGF